MSTPSWVVDDWYNEYWGHKYGESDFSTCTGHFTQVGRFSSLIAERLILITANIRKLQSKILCIFSACVERNQKGGLCYGWKVPLQRKKGRIQKGQVGISSVAWWSLRVVFKRRMVVACHYSPPGNIFGKFNQNVLAPKGESSSWMDARSISLRAGEHGKLG